MDDTENDLLESQGDVRAMFASSLILLRQTQNAATAQLTRAGREETVSLDDMLKMQKALGTALDEAFKMEKRYDDWIRDRDRDESGGGGDVDLDTARHEIGCRLDRLRACCHSE